jgi:hypothetical protein
MMTCRSTMREARMLDRELSAKRIAGLVAAHWFAAPILLILLAGAA